jgi:hypothetical protein
VAFEFITAFVLAIAGSWVLCLPLPIERPRVVHLRVADVAPRSVVRPYRRLSRSSADSPDH